MSSRNKVLPNVTFPTSSDAFVTAFHPLAAAQSCVLPYTLLETTS